MAELIEVSNIHQVNEVIDTKRALWCQNIAENVLWSRVDVYIIVNTLNELCSGSYDISLFY